MFLIFCTQAKEEEVSKTTSVKVKRVVHTECHSSWIPFGDREGRMGGQRRE